MLQKWLRGEETASVDRNGCWSHIMSLPGHLNFPTIYLFTGKVILVSWWPSSLNPVWDLWSSLFLFLTIFSVFLYCVKICKNAKKESKTLKSRGKKVVCLSSTLTGVQNT